MADCQVLYVEKSGDAHDKITEVGARNWRWTVEQVVESIKAKTNTFYTKVDGKRADIGVVRDPGKPAYLRTHADGKWNNNLLALPPFPK